MEDSFLPADACPARIRCSGFVRAHSAARMSRVTRNIGSFFKTRFFKGILIQIIAFLGVSVKPRLSIRTAADGKKIEKEAAAAFSIFHPSAEVLRNHSETFTTSRPL